MDWSLEVILECENHIKVLETKLDTLQMDDLDVGKSHDKEWGFTQVDETVLCGLQENVGPERYSVEGKIAEWNIDLNLVIAL